MITTFIYVIVERETETILYIGKTKNPIRRCRYWQDVFPIKYGCECEMILVDHIDHDLQNGWEQLEIDWIALFRETHEIWILNKLKGGNAPINEINALGGKARLGKRLSESHKISLSKSLKGKSHSVSDHVKRSISASLIGIRKSDAHRLAISSGHLGKNQPNISKSLKGKPRSDKAKTSISNSAVEARLVMSQFRCTNFRHAQKILKLIKKNGLSNQ